MERNSKIVFKEMEETISAMLVDGQTWVDKDTKSAAAKVRKATLALASLGKEFRQLSVAEAKG